MALKLLNHKVELILGYVQIKINGFEKMSLSHVEGSQINPTDCGAPGVGTVVVVEKLESQEVGVKEQPKENVSMVNLPVRIDAGQSQMLSLSRMDIFAGDVAVDVDE